MPHRVSHNKRFPHEDHQRSESSDVPGGGVVRSSQSEDPTSHSLLEKIRSMFSWIASRVTEEAREEVASGVSEASAKRLLSQYSSRDLIRRAEGSIAQLELSKQVLLQEFGSRAQAFVERYIDPVIDPVKSLVVAGREGKGIETVKGAVGGVELLAIMHDDSRLRRKIHDSLEMKTREAILEDIAFIMSYPSEALAEATIPASQRGEILRQIEEALQPVLLELESLLSSGLPAYEFVPLFQWREAIDGERQRLHDRAMQIIDEKIHGDVPLWRTLKNLPPNEVSPFLEEMATFAQSDRVWPLSIFELEELSSYLREIIEEETASRKDERLLVLFSKMKSHLEVFLESEEGEGHEEALTRIVDQVRAIDSLLGMG